MKFFNEFKTFIARGNVIDMAVGIIVGSAFTKIVNSLVADVITPAIGIITGKVDVANLSYKINEKLVIKYGSFIQALIDFIIIAFVVFVMIKAINGVKTRFEKKEEAAEVKEEPKPSNEEVLLTEIRDLLKNK